jgi:hypothetical protein
MTWIALADHQEQQFSLNGIGRPAQRSAQSRSKAPGTPDDILVRGTLMVETRLSPDGKPQDLLNYRGSKNWFRALKIHAIPGGGITLVIDQNNDVTHAAILHLGASRTDTIRITYAWDAPKRWARLAIERPDGSDVQYVQVANPKPIPIAELRALVLDQNSRLLSEDLIFLAISDRVEPVGPTPTLTCSVPIETSTGFQSASTLKRGDLVRTENAGLVPVLHNVRRTVPARGSFEPVRLRAPYFGLKQDVIVAPDQRLVIRGSEVEYLFGREAVLVPARHLVNGIAGLREQGHATVTYTQLVMPSHEILIAAGTAVESLYIARLRRKPDLLGASLLSHLDRDSLPEHGQSIFPVLRWFDAITLVEQRSA